MRVAGLRCMHACVQEAVRNTEYWRMRDDSGKAPGLLGWWPSRAVTFLDNHDTGAPLLQRSQHAQHAGHSGHSAPCAAARSPITIVSGNSATWPQAHSRMHELLVKAPCLEHFSLCYTASPCAFFRSPRAWA